MDVYLVKVELSFWVRARSNVAAARLAHGVLQSHAAQIERHATALEIINMEQPPGGSERIPWDGEVDAEEVAEDEKPPR